MSLHVRRGDCLESRRHNLRWPRRGRLTASRSSPVGDLAGSHSSEHQPLSGTEKLWRGVPVLAVRAHALCREHPIRTLHFMPTADTGTTAGTGPDVRRIQPQRKTAVFISLERCITAVEGGRNICSVIARWRHSDAHSMEMGWFNAGR